MTRAAFATALLLGALASAQPDTYFVPIAARTPTPPAVGATAMQTSLWLPDPGVDAAQSLLFGTGGGTSVPFLLGTLAPATLSAFPAQVDAVAAASGVLIGTQSRTLLAVSSGGSIFFGTVVSGTFTSAGGPASPIPGSSAIALSALPDGGAALLVLDASKMIDRWDLDLSSGIVTATRGFSGSGAPTGGGSFDEPNTLYFDGLRNIGFVGGRVLGDVYRFDPNLDAGAPTVFDAALMSGGRLAPPVSGLAVYQASDAGYLLAANGHGLTVYDLSKSNPALGGFRVIPQDTIGPITSPAGVAVTNLPAGTALPKGVVAVGDQTQTDLALMRWDVLAGQVDGGLVIDTTDPRGGGDGGSTVDAGVDGGGGGGGGGGGTSGGGGPLSPGIPVDHSSSCASTSGGPALAALLAVLALLAPRRRQRR